MAKWPSGPPTSPTIEFLSGACPAQICSYSFPTIIGRHSCVHETCARSHHTTFLSVCVFMPLSCKLPRKKPLVKICDLKGALPSCQICHLKGALPSCHYSIPGKCEYQYCWIWFHNHWMTKHHHVASHEPCLEEDRVGAKQNVTMFGNATPHD